MLLSLLLLGPAAQAGPPADLDRLFPRMGDVTDVHFGDLEPDGDLDAAVATHAGVYVVRQIATGRFELEGDPLPDTGLGDFSEGGVHLFDADGDGDLDVFVGKPGQDRLFRNDGPLGFADASGQVVSAIVSPHDLDSGDLDGDGDLDLYLVYGDGGGELLRNQGGSFTAEPITGIADLVRLADVDGDGDLDGVRARRGSCDPYSCWPGSAALALNDGTGSFVPAFFPSAEVWASDLAVGDMDGDGDPDVAISSYLGYPSLLFQNLGAGLFTSFPLPAVPISGRGVALPDVDSDGDLDVFFTGDGAPGGTEEILLLNTGAGLVNGSSRLPATPGREAGRAYVFDVDGDGDDDVVVEDTSPRVLLKGADARLVDVTPWAQAELATSAAVALGDLDGDGFADGVRGLGNTLSLLTNDGTGDLSPSVLASVTPFPSQDWTVALADVDGDGDLDAHSSVTSSDDSLHANDGAANLAPLPGALPVGFKSDGLTFFDADGDGDQDAAAPGLPNQLLVNAGPGTFTLLAEAQFPAGTGVARDAAAADFDLDGDLDLVFIGNSVGALYRNVGAGWTVDPYGATERDGAVFGRGAAVSKSDFATYAFALLALEAAGGDLAGGVELHLTYDEEAGGEIGPDLTGSNRANLDYILENILNPSGDIPEGYQMILVTTRGGQTYAGTLASENEQQLVLRVVGLPPVTVAKSEIQSRETIPTSMMPEGLMATMKDGEVVDLINYLRTTKQVGKK